MPESEGSSHNDLPQDTKHQVRLIGFPGESQGVVVVPHYVGDKSKLNANGPCGLPGMYTAEFLLAKPHRANLKENHIEFADALVGDSHLAIAEPAVASGPATGHVLLHYRNKSGEFEFHGSPNEDGYLAKLVSAPFHAADRNSAEAAATNAMQALLSNLSAHLDIPLITELVEITELATQSKGISFIAPFFPAPLAMPGRGSVGDPELEHAMALYREALNSNTPLYRFQCFYKILEMSRKRREKLGRKKSETKQSRPGERVPFRDKEEMEKWLNAIFYVNRRWDEGVLDDIFVSEALGKKISHVFDSQLRPIRDRIAHGILDSGEFLLLDKAEDQVPVLRWLPILRCFARRVMKNDFPGFLAFLNEDGNVH